MTDLRNSKSDAPLSLRKITWLVWELVDALSDEPVLGRRIIILPQQKNTLEFGGRIERAQSVASQSNLGLILLFSRGRRNGHETYSVVDGILRLVALQDLADLMTIPFLQASSERARDSLYEALAYGAGDPKLEAVARGWLEKGKRPNDASQSRPDPQQIVNYVSVETSLVSQRANQIGGIGPEISFENLITKRIQVGILTCAPANVGLVFNKRLNTARDPLDFGQNFTANWGKKTVQIGYSAVSRAIVMSRRSRLVNSSGETIPNVYNATLDVSLSEVVYAIGEVIASRCRLMVEMCLGDPRRVSPWILGMSAIRDCVGLGSVDDLGSRLDEMNTNEVAMEICTSSSVVDASFRRVRRNRPNDSLNIDPMILADLLGKYVGIVFLRRRESKMNGRPYHERSEHAAYSDLSRTMRLDLFGATPAS